MNGRLYDPVLGRMLSPDNFVQMPDYSQNFNRYSYVLNNPLSYVDPDGEIAWFVPVIFAAVNVATDLIISDGNMNFGEILLSAGQGALGGFLGGGSIVSGGQAFLSAAISQVNRLLPSIPIYQSESFSLSISPMIGMGTSGMNFGASLNMYAQDGDFVYSASWGLGYNSGMSNLGENIGGSAYYNYGAFAGWNDGHANYGLGFSNNYFSGKTAQDITAIHAQIGDFSLRVDEDLFGDGMDRYRTGGMLATYKINSDVTLAFGASMITGMARGVEEHKDGNPNTKYNMYTNEDYKIRGGTMFGGVIYKGQSYFGGHNSEKRLHDVQNLIHRNLAGGKSPYFPNLNLISKGYSYYGAYHHNYLYY